MRSQRRLLTELRLRETGRELKCIHPLRHERTPAGQGCRSRLRSTHAGWFADSDLPLGPAARSPFLRLRLIPLRVRIAGLTDPGLYRACLPERTRNFLVCCACPRYPRGKSQTRQDHLHLQAPRSTACAPWPQWRAALPLGHATTFAAARWRRAHRGPRRGASSCRDRCRLRRSRYWEPETSRAPGLWRPLPASLAGGAGARPDHPINGHGRVTRDRREMTHTSSHGPPAFPITKEFFHREEA